tara:strand:- start:53 stop:688 length:636 start_codon:yes stop_codon:yes gene_type:complete
MGQNSTEVAYGFGQLGSAFQNLAKPVYPPKDHVIVAIQFLADNTPTALITEILDSQGPQYFGTNDTEATAANYLGVTEAAVATAATTTTPELSSANSKIKAGQYVLLVNDGDTVDAGLTVDSETATPVYNGPNKAGVKVISYGGGTDDLVLDTEISPTTSQTLLFLDEYHGAGGTTAEGVKYPKGLTIYGRWATVTPEADADGGIICYFGK